MTKQLNLAIASVLVASSIPAVAQTTTTIKSPGAATTTKGTSSARHVARKKVTRESATAIQIRELRSEMQAQINDLKQQLADRDAKLNTAQAAVQTAQGQAGAAAAQSQTLLTQVQDSQAKLDTVQSTVSDLVAYNNGLTQTILNNNTELRSQIESPTTIRYKGITIMPVAFFAAESVYRTRSINSDINTPFNTTPFQGAPEAHVSEFNFTGRQSRLGALLTGDAGPLKLSGYFEVDFLSAGTTSNENQSNSFTMRQRQIWGQVATKSGFAMTGGQMWSLVTENGKGTDNRTEKLPNTVDSQYMVGYSWERQPGIRLQQRVGDKFLGEGKALTLAMALEQAQIVNYTATNAPNNFFFGGAGQNGGLYNAFNATPTNNVSPDVVLKAALDLPHSHYELGGVARFMRARYYPGVLTPGTGPANVRPGAGATNDVEYAGGVFGSARVTVDKYLDLGASAMGGPGVGRYSSAQLADATVRPTGKLEPLRNYHALISIETHPLPKLDVYGYGGGEYAQRTFYPTGVAASPYTGYGAPTTNVSGCNIEVPVAASGSTGTVTPSGTCNAQTRAIFEGTFGFTYRLVNSPKYGRLQYQSVYSYLTKSAWTGLQSGVINTPTAVFNAPKANNNMVWTGMRYYIP